MNAKTVLLIIITFSCVNFLLILSNSRQNFGNNAPTILSDVDFEAWDEEEQARSLLRPKLGYDAPLEPNVIFTSFFTQKKDPQRFFKHPLWSFRKSAPWYNSVVNNKLNALVFYDAMDVRTSAQFNRVSFYNATKNIGPRSTNDERFFVYHQYLKEKYFENANVTQRATRPRYLLLTDLFDIQYLKDPFEFMNLTESRTGREDWLYVGSEKRHEVWVQDRTTNCNMTYALADAFANRTTMVNAGIVGGAIETVYEFLQHMVYYLKDLPVEQNCNNVVFNYVCFKHMEERLVTGHPLHNVFGSGNVTAGVYIKHK